MVIYDYDKIKTGVHCIWKNKLLLVSFIDLVDIQRDAEP